MKRLNLFCHVLPAVLGLLAACSQPSDPPVAEPVALVTLEQVSRSDLPEIITGYGTVDFDPAGQRTLASEIEARVVSLSVQIGDRVKAGDEIARLRPSSSASVDLAAAKRDAATAEQDAARAERLRADGLASDADVETARTKANDLSAMADSLARRAGSISILTAPLDGVVENILADPGSVVSPGGQVIRLASSTAVQARINIEIEDAARVSQGDPVSVQALNNSGMIVNAGIETINARIDPANRTASVLANLPEPHGFLPGEAVQAEIRIGVKSGVIVAARSSIFNDESGDYVYVATNGAVSLRRIQTGLTVGDQTEVTSGLSAGEAVVVDGGAILSDGMKIRTGPEDGKVTQ